MTAAGTSDEIDAVLIDFGDAFDIFDGAFDIGNDQI